MIRLEGLTKDFTGGKGIFDLNFQVEQGEVFGYLGPNGAGKSTTIRHLMGFLRPDKGKAEVGGLDCWLQAPEIQKIVGYLPGEIAFLDGMNGLEFLQLLGGMRGMTDTGRRDRLIEQLQFDVKTPIRKMSKGMKQKVGIVAAFMHNPQVLLLDEPSSGLDPLMQQTFLDLVMEEKRNGKTILMSSHLFPEVEKVCDRVGIVKEGRLIAVEDMSDLQSKQRKVFHVTVRDEQDAERLCNSGLQVRARNGKQVEIEVQGDYNLFFLTLSQSNVENIDIHELNLEEIFMHFYENKEAVGQ